MSLRASTDLSGRYPGVSPENVGPLAARYRPIELGNTLVDRGPFRDAQRRAGVDRELLGLAAIERHAIRPDTIAARAGVPDPVDRRDAELDPSVEAVPERQVNIDVITVPVAVDVVTVKRRRQIRVGTGNSTAAQLEVPHEAVPHRNGVVLTATAGRYEDADGENRDERSLPHHHLRLSQATAPSDRPPSRASAH